MIIINLSKPFRFPPLDTVDHCFNHNKGCIRPHSYCIYPHWGSESARVTVRVWLLVREKVEVLVGRAGGLPSGPILSGLS
jgi:hypothetical protein